MKVTFPLKSIYWAPSFRGISFWRLDKRNVASNRAICKETFASTLSSEKSKGTFKFLLTVHRNRNLQLNHSATQDLLNQIEKKMGFPKSKVYEMDASLEYPVARGMIVEASNQWKKSLPLIHMLLLLVRNGSLHNVQNNWAETLEELKVNSYKRPDKFQFKTSELAIHHLVKRKGKTVPLLRGSHIGICQYSNLYKEQIAA